MTEMPLSRNEEIQQIHKDYLPFYQIGGGLFLVLIGVLIGALIFSNDSGYGTNIYTEILSVGLTIFVLDRLQERRDNRNRIKDLQDQLVREAGSPINAVAVNAVDTMRKRGWLGRKGISETPNEVIHDTISLLTNQNLSNADLHDVDLTFSNLSSAKLFQVNLSNAKLWDTNLSKAELINSNLTNAYLFKANLSGAYLNLAKLGGAFLLQANLSGASMFNVDLNNANLQKVNLNGADMHSVNLGGANLIEADLRGSRLMIANLTDAIIQVSTQFDRRTMLPDGDFWSPERDMAEFGAETREITDKYIQLNRINHFTFIDGTKRRWKEGTGWLDDRDGNPLP